MKDPALLIENTSNDIEILLSRRFKDEEDMKRSAFEFFLLNYEGFDILEVICREAAVLYIYENSSLHKNGAPGYLRSQYIRKLPITAEKYAQSEEWPKFETERAKEFKEYIEGL